MPTDKIADAVDKRTESVTGAVNATLVAERLRISSIIESSEGKRNPELAAELALRSNMDAEAARAILAKAPSDNPFMQAMQSESINVGPAPLDPTGKAARLAEIKVSMKAFNESRGYGKANRNGD